jgi:hypothetical protein
VGYFFRGKSYALILTNMGLATYIEGDFPSTHLVTLALVTMYVLFKVELNWK